MLSIIGDHLDSKYVAQLKTWKKVSEDDCNNTCMIDSESKCFDYDNGIVKLYNRKNQPKCTDGIIIKDDILYFIEFKNGKINKDTCLDIRLKAVESQVEFNRILKKEAIDINYKQLLDLEMKFILVYNIEKIQNTNPNQQHLLECIHFSNTKEFLAKYEGSLYKNIIVIDSENFKKHFLNE